MNGHHNMWLDITILAWIFENLINVDKLVLSFVKGWCAQYKVPECDKYIWIFEYSNIWVTNIYTDIRTYQFCLRIYLFVSNLFVRIYSDIHSWVLKLDEYLNIFEYLYNFQDKYLFGHSFVSKKIVQIYLDICFCNFFIRIYLIIQYSFVSKFSRMSHSGTYTLHYVSDRNSPQECHNILSPSPFCL